MKYYILLKYSQIKLNQNKELKSGEAMVNMKERRKGGREGGRKEAGK